MARRIPLNNPDDVIRCLEEDGGVILTNFSSVNDLHTVNQDVAPYINAIAEERSSNGVQRYTIRIYRLFGLSTTAREKWLQQHDLWIILRHFLRTVSVPFNDASSTEVGTDPILSVAATLDVGPGVQKQDLHRDDFIWQQTHDEGELKTYRVGRDVSMGLLVAGEETTGENGATLENQFLWWKKEEIEKWSVAAQKQAGYVLENPFLGHCDEGNPVDRFRASSM
ncbi:MAG: hypothetical protein Q9164_001670 [Protoblastenia rupestris]